MIDKLSMDFKMDRIDFAKELYGSWEGFCRHSVEKVIEETLSPFNRNHEVIEIEELVIEIGNITEADFYEKFPSLFRQKLYEQFTGLLYQPDYATRGKVRIRSLHSGQLDAWIFFLRNGYIPSEMSELYRYPERLFETLIENDPTSLIETLHREWHQDRVRRRLTEQLNDKSLIRIIEVKEPEQADFIAQFISNTQFIRFDKGIGRRSPSASRSILWIAAFSFLFFSNQSVFSRKEYLRYTLRELAAHYNLYYSEVLLLLHACFAGMENETTTSGIRLIIQELVYEQESAEKEVHAAKQEESKPITLMFSQPENVGSSLRAVRNETAKQSSAFRIASGKAFAMPPYNTLDITLETILPEKTKGLLEQLLFALDGFLSDPELRTKITGQLRQLAEIIENNRFYLSEEKIVAGMKIKTILQEISRLSKIEYRELLIHLQNNLSEGKDNSFTLILHDLTQDKMENKEQQNWTGENTNVHNAGDKLYSEIPDSTRIMIENAGLVLLSPYLPQLFRKLSLIEGNRFVSTDAQIKAIFLLQELLRDKQTEYSEHALFLNKLLTGYTDNTKPLPLSFPLSELEKSTCSSLLEGSKANWSKLKNTSVDGLCEAFFQRNGVLEKKEDHWSLKIEEKAYDILLDSLPWSYTPVKFPWMKEVIHVQWR